jgi:putative phage-type endonuclease
MCIEKYLKTCSVVSRVAQDTDEKGWLAARNKGIGGSDIGPICGVSPFTSARQIYLNKTGQYPTQLKINTAASERMYFGHKLEPIVADEYAARVLCEGGDHPDLHLVNYNVTLRHNEYTWALANVDRFIVDKNNVPVGILECKTTSEYMNDEWANGELLLTYLYQLNWYLFVTGLQWGAFACLVGGNKFYTYEVVRNDELINDILIPNAEHFWNHNVRNLIEPALQAQDTEFINGLYDTVVKNSEIAFTDEAFNDLAAVAYGCKQQIKELKAEMEAAQNAIKERMQDNEIAYCNDYMVKWKLRNQSRVDTSLLKARYPDVYEDCLKRSSYRAMTITYIES